MNRRCAVIGSGYWGENHIRILSNLNILDTFYDKNFKNKSMIEKKYRLKSKSINQILRDPNIDCIFITTPSDTHINILKQAIKHNKNIFVEKPLVTRIKDLNEINKLIKDYQKITMVGHLMLYHAGIIEVKHLINDKKKFGKLKFIEFFRRNFGKIRSQETSFMSFTPHDFSIADFLTSKKRKSTFKCINNHYSFFRNKNCYDMGNAKFLVNNTDCFFNYSWISPEKSRKINLYFEKGIVVFDDLKSWDEKILIIKSTKNIIKSHREDIIRKFHPINVTSEPLENEIKVFIDHVIRNKEVEFTSIKKCLNVYKSILTTN